MSRRGRRDPSAVSRRHRIAVWGLPIVAAIAVAIVSAEVFPYHTSNHDEAVYLQQAALLLDGQLSLDPPVPVAFRPWFFLEGANGQLYPKYSPLTAAVFAVGKLLGGYRVALSLVAAGVVALTVRLGSDLFDRTTGLIAGGLLLASPLFLVQSSVFLPYVPTTLWNLTFAAAYFHADTTGSRRAAAVAGGAIGVAVFARPYTAVLFALPFVAHAVWTLRRLEHAVIARQTLTAVGGLAGVALALGYNAIVTGDPLVFPYEAFAPLDGLGFGRREILGYSRDYTPALALRANAEALWIYATKWVVAGSLGTLMAVVGLVVTWRREITAHQTILAGVAVTVVLGNLYFWGTLNTLGDLELARDGLIHYLGPYYHVDLLVPTVIFGAVGVRYGIRAVRSALTSRRWATPRRVTAVLAVCAILAAGVSAGMVAGPLADNHAVTERYESAYEPFEDRSLSDSLVFLPTPYGDWLGHPFQALRNDPGYDDGPVYALEERPFAVVDAFPDRELYRYAYRGAWAPTAGHTVTARLQPVDHVQRRSVTLGTELGMTEYAESVSIRLASEDDEAYGAVDASGRESLALDVTVNGSAATLAGDDVERTAIEIDGRESLVLTAFVDYGTGAGFSYRIELPVESDGGTVSALTPIVEVCRDGRLCRGEAAYVPGAHRDGVSAETTLTATKGDTI